jgi:murein DD-endopeptidase MepM/ murein hydrolase activator NlpD
MTKKIFMLAAMFIAAASCPAFSAEDGDTASIMLDSNIIKEGGLIKAIVTCPEKFKASEAVFLGHTYPVFYRKYDPMEKEFVYTALLPVALDTSSGVKKVRLKYMLGDGAHEHVEKITVKKLKGEVSSIDTGGLASDLSGDMQKENALIISRLDKVTPVKYEFPFIKPTEGEVSGPFGVKRTYDSGASWRHKGMDIANKVGTKIFAVNNGEVVESSTTKGHGIMIIIDHGGGVYSMYFHMSGAMVKTGDIVKKGDLIGLMGATGMVTGPHLHWQMELFMKALNPLDFCVNF